MTTPLADPIGDLGIAVSDDTDVAPDLPWKVILWNDPVNLASYVTGVLVRVLSISAAKAESLMLIAHSESKAAVFDGAKDAAETKALQLLSSGLTVTVEKD